MGKPVTAVAFRDDAPMDAFDWALKTMNTPSGPVRYMDCAEVAETGFGMLRLTPRADPASSEFGVYIHPHYVLWMIRSTTENRPGFLP